MTVEEAYSKWATALTQYAAMLVGPDDAGDVVGDVFARLLSEPARLDGLVDHRPYLYRSVLNAVRMRARSDRRRTRREWTNSSSQHGAELLRDPAVVAAVRQLSVQQRAVTYLAYWEDLDVSTIAGILDVSEGTVRRQLARSRSKLREALA
jgi:RNA polymerase sigma factor (sigma-70 family)